MDAPTLQLVSAGSASLASGFGVAAWLRARKEAPLATETQVSLWRRLVNPIAIHLRPTSGEELEILGTRLACAGRRSREEIDRYCEERVAAIFAGMALALAFSFVGGMLGAMLSLVTLVLGILGPSKIVDTRAAERREAI